VQVRVEDTGYGFWFLESLDRVNRAIAGSSDLEEAVDGTLAVLLEVFGCDRAWLVFPLDLEATTRSVLMEKTRPEYPGAVELGREIRNDAGSLAHMRVVLEAEGAVRLGAGAEPLAPDNAQVYSIRSMLAMALRPKLGKPWMFGLHQCSRERVWSLEEGRLFAAIGHRVEDALTSLLAYRDLREGERKLAEAQRLARVGYWERDLVTDRIDCSEETYRLYGIPRGVSELSMPALAEHLHPDDRRAVVDAYERAIGGGPRYEVDYRVILPDGETRYLHSEGDVTWDESGRPIRMFGTAQDITERKRSEERLSVSEGRLSLFRSLIDQTNDMIEVIDHETGRFLDVNETACSVHGYTREEFLALSVTDISPDSRPWEQRRDERRARSPFFESTHRRKDGSVFPVEVSVADVVLDRHYVLAVVRDTTERKRAEASLSIFRSLFDQTEDMIQVVDHETGRFLDVNETACRVHGYTREEFLALSVSDIAPRADQWPRTREDRRAGPPFFESLHRRKDGSVFPVEISVAYVALDRKYVLAVVRDISERKRLEDQLRQSQKMEAVGRLAGGVAHDFNNLMTVINGHAALVLAELASDDRHRESLVDILRAGDRAAALTRQLLAFSRKQRLEPQVISLNSVLRDLARMLERLIGEDIALLLDLEPGLALTKVDPGQFEQAIVNLAVNARDAMPTGGQLTIQTRNDQDGLVVQVSDIGHGMDTATAASIFEPFFTTKEDIGTGLGLPMVYGFVTQSGGRVDVETEPGRGTTFRIWLPISDETPTSLRPTPELPPAASGNETVLLVEDDDGVRALARIVLETNGYTVLEAADGETAIELARKHNGPIEMLLSDVVMARMSGPQLAEVLSRERPEVRVLFVSGYTGTAELRHGARGAIAPLLQKPFDPTHLARRVREVLDEER
jgi:PAS domain S-box-containing protein